MIPVTLLQERSLLALSPPALCWCPVSAPTPRLRGADPQPRGWVCMETAPSPLPQELPGKFPLLQSVPVPLPSLQPCQPRCSASRAISGSTLRHVPSAVGTMLKEMDLGGEHPPPVPVPRRTRQSGQGCGGAVCLEGKRCSSSSCGAVMWQWDPEIRACPGTESPRSLLQPPGARRVVEGLESPPGSVLSSPRINPSVDQLLQQLGAGAGARGPEGAGGGYCCI